MEGNKMALLGKFNKDELLATAKKAADKATDLSKKAAEKASDIAKDGVDSLKQYQGESKELKAPVEGAIIRYGVVYNGGLPQYPKEKSGEIGFNVMPDSFILKATATTKDWFSDFEISYDKIKAFEIVKRQAGTWEMMLSSPGSNVKDTETENVIAITYDSEDGTEIYLRLEMLTGINVYTQAKKCQELLDVLRQNKILNRINKGGAASAPSQAISTADELKKYKELLDTGVLTQEEFDAKKKQLLGL
jgi:hypothetical protein